MIMLFDPTTHSNCIEKKKYKNLHLQYLYSTHEKSAKAAIFKKIERTKEWNSAIKPPNNSFNDLRF